jgi:hypothetical protein
MKITIWPAVAFVCFSSVISGAQSGPRTGSDDRYCRPGNVPAFGEKDGPAILPQSCFYTALSATPSPGKEIAVSSGEDLQKAIAQARCGDTLLLHSGTSYVGAFEFPAKGCDDTHWITVRTDGDLPKEGTRTSPCYAGVASLKGRPPFACSNPKKEMATVVVPPRRSIKVADHYRFMGLEITRAASGGIVYDLVNAQNGTKIIFDRAWMHGTAEDETTRAVAFPGATYIAAIDSYFSDLHCVARTGSCTDSQTLWAGTGPVAGGTYKIVNNYLESAGEGVLFGGGGGATPTDIEIRRNYFYKPPSWNRRDPNFIGITYIVKNNLEFKNAARALVEGNVLENSWGGFTQMGFQLLLTPKNQNSRCPECVVHDITVRYCVLRHSGSGVQLANTPDGALHGVSRGMSHVSIHDLIIDDIDANRYAGNGFTFQISNDDSPLQDLTIDHVTVPHSERMLFVVGGPTGGNPMSNITISNSILDVGAYEAISTGARGAQNCAYRQRFPRDIFDSCWKPYRFTNNVLIRPHGAWPSGNFSAGDVKRIGFAAVQNDSVLDFRLKGDSPYRRKGEGQTDLGADAAKIAEEIAGATE